MVCGDLCIHVVSGGDWKTVYGGVFFCMYVWCFVVSGVGTNVEKDLNWYQESS